MTAKMEYVDYLMRLARNSDKTAQEFNTENIVREVGKSYGLSLKLILRIVKELFNKQ